MTSMNRRPRLSGRFVLPTDLTAAVLRRIGSAPAGVRTMIGHPAFS